jgi:osmoprotectant transport system permease protein
VIAAALPGFNFVFHHKKLSNWGWLHANTHSIWTWSVDTLFLALVSVIIALAISLPLGVLCMRAPRLYGVLLVITTFLYSLPSLAVFAILVVTLGPVDITVIIPLTSYALALLIRSVVDGLRNVSDEVRLSAEAMGYGTLRRIITVELPVAVPVIATGLRVTTVSSISLVSVASLIGVTNLGQLFIAGENANYKFEVLVGIVLFAVWAFIFDALILAGKRALTPWARTAR